MSKQGGQRSKISQKQVNRAIIVSQSFSDELEPLNVDMPVIMLPVGNVPIIDLLIKHLLTYGITILHIIGSDTLQIERYLKQQQQYSKMQITYHIYESQNNIELLANFFKKNPGVFGDNNDEYCYLFNGPIVTNVNLYTATRIIDQMPSANLVLTQKLRGGSLLALPEAPFQMVLGEDGRLLSINRANKRTQAQTLNLSGPASKQKVDVTLCQQPSQIYLLNYQFLDQLKSYYMQSRGTMSVTAFLEWVCPQPDRPLDIFTCNEGPGQLTCVINSMRQYRGSCRAFLKRYFHPHGPSSGLFNPNISLHNFDSHSHSHSITQQITHQNYKRWVWNCRSPEIVVGIGTQIYREAQLEGQCIIGSGCRIRGCVSGCQIQDNCTIDTGSLLKNCVVMERVSVGAGSKLEATILMSKSRIEQNIVLPRGSVVGRSVVVTWKLVQATVRFFLLFIWDATRECSRHLCLGDQEMAEIKAFLADQSKDLPDFIIERLPPIFLMKQEISSKEKSLRNMLQNVTTQENFWQYQLCDMQESHTKKAVDEAIREQQRKNMRSYSFITESMTNEQFTSHFQSLENILANELQLEEEEEIESEEGTENDDSKMPQIQDQATNNDELSEDLTEPAKLALEIANNMESQKDDDYWIPNYVIRLAKQIRDDFNNDKASFSSPYDEENRKDLFKRISLEVSRRVLGQGLRNSFSVLQQTHNEIIVQSVYSKPMKQFLRSHGVKPDQNTNEVVYNTRELVYGTDADVMNTADTSDAQEPPDSTTETGIGTGTAIDAGSAAPIASFSPGSSDRWDIGGSFGYGLYGGVGTATSPQVISNDAIIRLERRRQAREGAGHLHRQRVMLLGRREENIQVQILQILQGILRNQGFANNEIDGKLSSSVIENLQQLRRLVPVREQDQEAFRSQTLRTLLLITLNDTDGVDKSGNLIKMRPNINRPVVGSGYIFQKLLEFMCHGDKDGSFLIGRGLDPLEVCMYVMEDISSVMVQAELDQEEHLILAKQYILALSAVKLIDLEVLVNDYMPDFVEEFETDDDTELFQQKLFRAWDNIQEVYR